jgi:hypothetical protein
VRIGFLFNHDANHQIPHTLPVAAALAARGVDVEILVSTPAQGRAVRAMLPHGAAVRLTALEPAGLARAADRVLRHVAPFRRVAVLRANLASFARLDALVVPETTSTLLRTRFGVAGPRLIYLPHGAGDGAAGFQGATRHFDLVLLSGAKVARRMLAAGLVSPGGYAIVGYPKFDLADRGARLDPFGNGRPTVLYNPHFNPLLSSWYGMGAAVLDWFAAQDRLNLIFAPHVMLFRRRVHTSLIHRRVRLRPAIPARVRNHPGILLDTGSMRSIDMSYARAADIYLGDVSSQLYEWIRAPRPAIFLNTHRSDWRDSPDYRFWALGRVIGSVAELGRALDLALAGPDPFADLQAEAAADTFSVTAQPAGERAADAILAFMRGQAAAA